MKIIAAFITLLLLLSLGACSPIQSGTSDLAAQKETELYEDSLAVIGAAMSCDEKQAEDVLLELEILSMLGGEFAFRYILEAEIVKVEENQSLTTLRIVSEESRTYYIRVLTGKQYSVRDIRADTIDGELLY